MAEVTGMTAARMAIAEAASVIRGFIRGDNLILVTRGGDEMDGGNVRGPKGDTGPVGSITASPAGGSLNGNYPNPGIANGAVTDIQVASANKDGVATKASMRTLGTNAQQAAAGNHSHDGLTDSGWLAMPTTAGTTPPFGSPATVHSQYKKVGDAVHVRIEKALGSDIDRSTNTTGNFGNINVCGPGSVPPEARPLTWPVGGIARIQDTPVGVSLQTDGSIVWSGGFPRLYPKNSSLIADFFFFTEAVAP